MRTIETTIYKFPELSEKAKERAINDYWQYNDKHWANEDRDTLNAFQIV